MIDINYDLLINIFFISIFFNFLLFYTNLFKTLNTLKQIQDIHIGNPSRLGGLIIYLIFFGYEIIFLRNNDFILWISLAIIIPAVCEDIRILINPLIRLVIILTSCFFVVFYLPNMPVFDFGILNLVFNNKIFQIIFFTLAMATVTNGVNIIDGTNGLSAFSILSIFACLLFLGFYVNDQDLVNTCLFIMTLVIGFLVFNYPFGKIFLGDTGSYFLGFFASYIVLSVFAKYPELPTWCAVSILFYPTLEVIFSYFRKILQKKSPFYPDNKHLHLKIFFLLSRGQLNGNLSNALVAPFLSIVWLTPLALLPFSLQYPIWSILVLIVLILIYLFFYFAIPDPISDKLK